MSNTFQVKFKVTDGNDTNFYYGNSLGAFDLTAGSSFIGLSRSDYKGNKVDRSRVARVSFQTPSEGEKIYISKILFQSIDTSKAFNIYSCGSGVKNAEKIIYGALSKNKYFDIDSIKSTEEFEIDSGLDWTVSSGEPHKKELVCEFDKPIELDSGTTYYLYVFTKSEGGTSHHMLYRWAGEKENNYSATATFTYTAEIVNPPDNFSTSTAKVVTPNPEIELTWSKPSEMEDKDYSYVIMWSCEEKSGEVAIDSSENSYSLILNDLPRGKLLQIKMATKLNSVVSNFVELEEPFIVNSLPQITKITFTNQTISKSQPTEITYTDLLCEHDDTNQPLTFYYKIDGQADFEPILNKKLKVQNEKNLLIKAHDGLEFSEVFSYPISEDTDGISISILSVPSDFKIEYVLANNTCKFSWTGEKNIAIQVKTDNSWIEVMGNSAYSLSNFLPDNNTISFSSLAFVVRAKQNTFYSDEQIYTINPSILPSSTTFLDSINFSIGASWSINNAVFLNGENIEYNSTNLNIQISNPNQLTPNQVYTIQVEFKYGTKPIWLKTYNLTVKDFAKIVSVNNPYTTFGVYDGMSGIGAWQLNMTTNPPEENITYSLILKHENSTQTINSLFNDTLNNGRTIKLNESVLSQYLRLVCPDIYSGFVDIEAYFQYQYGNVVFQAEPIILKADYWKLNAKTPSLTNQIYEGYQPSMTISQDDFISGIKEISYELQIDRNDGQGFVIYDLRTWTKPSSSQSIARQFSQIGEIADEKERKWRIKTYIEAEDGGIIKEKIGGIVTTSVIKHIAPSGIQIVSSDYGNSRLTIQYTVADYGYSNSEVQNAWIVEAFGASGKIPILGDLSVNDSTIIAILSSKPETIKISLKTSYKGVEKTGSSPQVSFGEIPTIAYRSHGIGINTSALGSEEILRIAPHSGRNSIILQKSNGDPLITINLSNGVITGIGGGSGGSEGSGNNAIDQGTVSNSNIIACTLVSCIIDCGNWDDGSDDGGSGDTGGGSSSHSHAYQKISSKATCTDGGEEIYRCSCGDIDIRLVDALGHDMGAWRTIESATCTKKGIRGRDCSRSGCNYAEFEDIAATGHVWGSGMVTKEPTESNPGILTRTCQNCSETREEEIPALGGHNHDYTSTVTAPTCTEQGYTTHTCGTCDYTYTDSTVAALGHNLRQWTVVNAATCTTTGSKQRKCSRCDYYETEVIPTTEHTYTIEEVIPPTCTVQGHTIHKCTCGKNYVDTYVPVIPHSFTNYISNGDGTKTASCDYRCGTTKTIDEVVNSDDIQFEYEFLRENGDPIGHPSAQGIYSSSWISGGCKLKLKFSIPETESSKLQVSLTPVETNLSLPGPVAIRTDFLEYDNITNNLEVSNISLDQDTIVFTFEVTSQTEYEIIISGKTLHFCAADSRNGIVLDYNLK